MKKYKKAKFLGKSYRFDDNARLKTGDIILILYETSHGARFKLIDDVFTHIKGRERQGWISYGEWIYQ